VCANLRPLAARKELALSCDLPDDLPELTADPQRVAQVLTNLLNNAIKFTPEGGRIAVRARREAGAVRGGGSDTGIGIVAAGPPHLFQPFPQVDMSPTRGFGGTGLGLSISKALVEAHGGVIGVSSEPGRGSTFWFTLPLDAA